MRKYYICAVHPPLFVDYLNGQEQCNEVLHVDQSINGILVTTKDPREFGWHYYEVIQGNWVCNDCIKVMTYEQLLQHVTPDSYHRCVFGDYTDEELIDKVLRK